MYKRDPDDNPLWVESFNRLKSEGVLEGEVAEYLAHLQGLPITRSLARGYIRKMQLPTDTTENAKSLGYVVFSCSDGLYTTNQDLGTLARYFELIDDVLQHTTLEKDENGGIIIPISLSIEMVRVALQGIYYYGRHLSNSIPYYALLHLRPRDTAYYMRYRWEMGEKGLKTLNGELSEEKTVEFLMDVSRGLDDYTRAYLSNYNRIVGCTLLGPLISHIVEWKDDRLLGLLLKHKPSIHLYVASTTSTDVVKLLPTIHLTDNGEGLSNEDWEKIQERMYFHLQHAQNWDEYMRLTAILGLNGHFIPPYESFTCPYEVTYPRAHLLKLPILPWMDEDMTNCVTAANESLGYYHVYGH
jgi:hypothetical protein